MYDSLWTHSIHPSMLDRQCPGLNLTKKKMFKQISDSSTSVSSPQSFLNTVCSCHMEKDIPVQGYEARQGGAKDAYRSSDIHKPSFCPWLSRIMFIHSAVSKHLLFWHYSSYGDTAVNKRSKASPSQRSHFNEGGSNKQASTMSDSGKCYDLT